MSNKEKYLTPYGNWKVTTEGDCEGKSTTQLGTYTGYIDEIALFLANKSYYGLQFSAVIEQMPKNPVPTAKSVNVSLDIDSGTWDLSPEARMCFAQRLFRSRPVIVGQSNYYACFTLQTEMSEEDLARESALKKLTDEEKRLLGLTK